MKLKDLIEQLQKIENKDLEVVAFYYDDKNNRNIETYLHMISLDENKIVLEMEEII